MPEPFDSAIKIQAVDEILQEQYFSEFLQRGFVTGNNSLKLLTMSVLPVTGDGITFQANQAITYSARVSRDALSDFDAATAMDPSKVKARFNESDPTLNDFTHITVNPRLTEYDLKGAPDGGAIVSLAEKVNQHVSQDVDWHLALLHNVPVSMKVGDVNGTPKKNDRAFYASCSASPTTTMRVLVDASVGPWFRQGVEYDIYNGSTLVLGRVRCTDMNPADRASGSLFSAAFETTTRTVAGSSSNFSGVADNHTFYVAGSRNKGMLGLEAWMTEPASGDSFFGVDRNLAAYNWLVPTLTRVGQTATKINRDHLNEAGNVRAYISDDPEDMVVIRANPDVCQTLKNQFEDSAFIPWPTDDARAKRFANLGVTGIMFQHVSLGRVQIVGDSFMSPDKVDILNMDGFKQLSYGGKGLHFLKPNGSRWQLLPSGTAGAGYSMFWGMHGYLDVSSFCTHAKKQTRILNITN